VFRDDSSRSIGVLDLAAQRVKAPFRHVDDSYYDDGRSVYAAAA
jgi:hypothetical protein